MNTVSVESVSSTPLTEDAPVDADAAYMLHSPIDIVAVLRDISRNRTLVNVHFGGQDSLITPLVGVDSAAGELLFDRSGSGRLNQAVLAARQLLFYTSQDNVKIRFSTAAAREVRRDNDVAFAVRLPETMLRLQRRECFRIVAPVLQPIQCIVTMTLDDEVRYVDTRVHDISQGGVSLLLQTGQLPAEAGKRYPNCRLNLPNTGNAVVTLETVFWYDVKLLNGQSMARVGCKYVRPTMPALALIQRHIMKLERERKTRD